jgi:hypothetical protein
MAAGFGCFKGLRLSCARLVAIALFSVLTAFYITPAANAAVPATCDPQYWNAMRAKAWMEAQREIAQNQNLIYKADSVLEYSCFDNFLRALASNAITMFSENESIFGVPVVAITSTSMDNALNRLVASGLSQYVNSAFGHNFLGGRSSFNHSPSASITQGAGYTYTCSAMANAWNAARCLNFNNQPAVDDFFDIGTYNSTSWDPRGTIPQNFTCTPPSTWSSNYNLATNNPVTYQEQTVAAQLNFFSTGPANCSGSACCPAPRIPTGIQVRRGQGSNALNYAEFVCVNPGCAYDRASNSCIRNPAP